jgi:hypothetical protein
MTMSGDFSRRRFDKHNNFSSVLHQQGRVSLDSDHNEGVQIDNRRLRAETIGTIGQAVVPLEGGRNQDAFAIAFDSSNNLVIGPGRLYLDGLLAENHGAGSFADGTVQFDPILEEDRATHGTPYNTQPYLPNAQLVASLPTAGTYVFYLDAWQREVGNLEQPGLVESAVGVDTTARMQIAWQVKYAQTAAGPGACSVPSSLTTPSGGRLSSRANGVPTTTDLCKLPPSGGYRGLENRLYRIEIHQPGAGNTTGGATFKWSRDNASIGTQITKISSDRLTLTLASLGKDAYQRLAAGDWIEVTDDWIEFGSQPGVQSPMLADGASGVMAQVKQVHPESATVELVTAIPNIFNASDASRNTRLRKWDQKGKVLDDAGTVLVDLDAAGSLGVIPVPAAGTWVQLEDGVEINFDTISTYDFHNGEYWNFVARTADASVETLDRARPLGPHHHFCPLAVVAFPANTATPPSDCRTFWPVVAAASCDCTVCVTFEQFKTDPNSIQAAVNLLQKTGGRLCLGPGIYPLRKPITVVTNVNNASIHISGRGESTILQQPPSGPAIIVGSAKGGLSPAITIEDLQIWMSPDTKDKQQRPGLNVINVLDFALRRCWIIPDPRRGNKAPSDAAISLNGLVVDVSICDSNLNGLQGILATDAISANLRIDANNIEASQGGIEFVGVLTVGDTRLTRNNILIVPSEINQTIYTGILLFTTGALESRMEVDANYIVMNVPTQPQGTIASVGVLIGQLADKTGPSIATVLRITDNDIVIDWVSGIAYGMAVTSLDILDQLLLESNTIRGMETDPTGGVPNPVPVWMGLYATAPVIPLRGERLGVRGNRIECYMQSQKGSCVGVNLTVSGECQFIDNMVNNDGALASSNDVTIVAATAMVNNNHVVGPSLFNSIPLRIVVQGTSANTPVKALAIGNICNGGIQINGNSPDPQTNLNIVS